MILYVFNNICTISITHIIKSNSIIKAKGLKTTAEEVTH